MDRFRGINTSPHNKAPCILNSLSLICLIRFVISWNRNRCRARRGRHKKNVLNISGTRLAWNPDVLLIHSSWGNTRPGKYTAYNNLKASDTSWSIRADTKICHVTDDKLTLSSFTNNSSRISNICNKQTVTYNDSCWGSWASISSLTAVSFKKFWICLVVSFGCSKIIEGYQDHHIAITQCTSRKSTIVNMNTPIAALVSVMNFGCLIKLLKRCCLTYSAALTPPWPTTETENHAHLTTQNINFIRECCH